MRTEKDKRFFFTAVGCLLVFACLPPLLALCGGGTRALAPSAEAACERTEMRGLWIATVAGIDFPSAQNLNASALAKELDGIVRFAKSNGFNTLLFQVRPAADALYPSEIFPPSAVLSGRAGVPPDGDFDCLGYLLGAAHASGISLYAWVNPLRAGTGTAARPFDRASLAENSPAALHPEWTAAYGGALYFDAGIPAVRALVADGLREICENYAVDGIVFDDYFYPYPSGGEAFDDAATYKTYGGGFSEIGDFRRDSVNRLIKLCYDTVKRVRPAVRFGVSPHGIWKNGEGGALPRGAAGYTDIYCDALSWVEGGYIDFLAPQLYLSFDHGAAPFGMLAEFWNGALRGSGVALYIGYGVYRYAEGRYPRGEITAQVLYARSLSACRGGFYYGCAALRENAGGVLDELRTLFAETG